jgi:very-short-patch-repair endonuclease
MRFAEQHKEVLINAYKKENRSTYDIAEELHTYPNKILRALKYLNVNIRTKSSAQANAIKQGRHTHPTKGKKRTEESKLKISEGMALHWKNMPEEEREERAEMSRKQWEAMSEEDRKNLQRKAIEAVLKASKEGSKIEKFIFSGLTKLGYDVLFHKKGLIDEKFEIDLCVPDLRTVIEIDGPAHFFPIWGEEALQKNIRSDAQKSGLTLSSGFVMIRVKNTSKSLSQKLQRECLGKIVEILQSIEKKFPAKQDRYIEFEV